MNLMDHLETARKFHASHPVADIHSDIPTDVYRRRSAGERAVVRRLHLPRLRAGGVSICGMAVNNDSFVGGMQADQALRRVVDMLDAMQEEADETPEMALVFDGRGVRNAVEDGRLAVPLGLEGGACIGQSLGTLRTLHRLGIRSIVLTWNYRNGIGDGIAEEAGGGGLTRFGVDCVKEMQRLGVLVDVSHLAPIGVRQVLAIAERPIVASHSNARALCDHRRNLTDDVIEGIARSGGLVGVCFYPGFIDPAVPTLERLLDHVDYLVRLAGEDHVAVGADYVDYMKDYIEEKLQAAGVGYASHAEYPEGLEGIDRFHNFTAGLLARGYRHATIAKILGENYLRVVAAAVD